MTADRKLVLIVDDQEDARAFTRAVVSQVGDFRIETASNGEQALQFLMDEKPALIVLDVVMPGLDGFTFFREIRRREELRAIPVVMLTGVSEDLGIQFTQEGIREHFGTAPSAFLEKPVDPQELEKSVREALRS